MGAVHGEKGTRKGRRRDTEREQRGVVRKKYIMIHMSRNITNTFLCALTEKGNESSLWPKEGPMSANCRQNVHFSLQESGHFKIRRRSEKQNFSTKWTVDPEDVCTFPNQDHSHACTFLTC